MCPVRPLATVLPAVGELFEMGKPPGACRLRRQLQKHLSGVAAHLASLPGSADNDPGGWLRG